MPQKFVGAALGIGVSIVYCPARVWLSVPKAYETKMQPRIITLQVHAYYHRAQALVLVLGSMRLPRSMVCVNS